jgi:hypothetical protein
MERRARIMSDFRAGRFDILLLSEVGSEGLDFEFCQALVNYDLPWNPMRVEQRIGRLDRFGQRHEKIFIFNFHVPGTIETDIFERLYERIRVFEESIGELEPILRDEFSEVAKVVLDPSLTDEQRQRLLDQRAVAVEQRRKDLEDIEASQGLLTGVDELLIEGLMEDTTRRGRFVGRSELEILLRRLLKGTRARLRPMHGGIFELRGDDQLADAVSRHGRDGASRYTFGSLIVRLRDADSLFVTFDNEEAARSTHELLSLRHPLIIAAVNQLKSSEASLARFGTIRIAGKRAGSYLTAFYVVRTTGLLPSLELWPITVDSSTLVVTDDVGFAVLAALAAGELRQGPAVDGASLAQVLEVAEDHVHAIVSATEAERRQRNEALVTSRQDALAASFQLKIARAEQILAEVRLRGRERSIQRIYEGRIRNLGQAQGEAVEALEERRALAMTVKPIALAVVEVG